MKRFFLKRSKAISGIIGMLLIGSITMSFNNHPLGYSEFTGEDDYGYETYCTDTLPDKEGITMKAFNNLQAELDKTLGKVDAELKGIDFDKLQKDATELALHEIDLDKMLKSVELSLKRIDMEKTMAEINTSLKGLSLDQKSAEIEKAIAAATKAIETAKLEIKEIDKEALKKELANAKKEIEKSKPGIGKVDINKIMDEARADIEKAKAELTLTKEMFTEMEKDGLINSKAGFTTEYRNKELYIDVKKQDEKTTNKYRKYFKDNRFKIIIEKE